MNREGFDEGRTKRSEGTSNLQTGADNGRRGANSASHSTRAEPRWTRLTIRIRSAAHSISLLNPRPLEMTIIPVIIPVSVLESDTRRTGVGERSGLRFSSVPVIMISDERRVFGCLMIGGWKRFPGSRHELVEGRQAHPDII